MKRLIIAAVIFVLIITVCITGNCYVSKTISAAKKDIENCKKLYSSGQFEKAYKAAVNFKKSWIKTSKSLSIYSNHQRNDDIGILSSVLPDAVKEKTDYEFYSAISQIETLLKGIYNEQTLTIESLY